MPALVYMIDELQKEGSTDSFSNYLWFMKMKQFYKEQGKDFVEEVTNADSNIAEIVQEMLQSPIGKVYRDLLENEA